MIEAIQEIEHFQGCDIEPMTELLEPTTISTVPADAPRHVQLFVEFVIHRLDCAKTLLAVRMGAQPLPGFVVGIWRLAFFAGRRPCFCFTRFYRLLRLSGEE